MSIQLAKDRVSLGHTYAITPQENFADLLLTRHRYEVAQLRAELVKMHDENARLKEELLFYKESSIKDALTDTFNRRFLDIAIDKIIATEMREKRSWGIIIIDIDRFKQINDDYGHYAGDNVLKNVSHMMRHISRNGDFVVRYGGDEFLIIVLNVTQDELTLIADRYRKSVSAVYTMHEEQKITVTISVGACFVPFDSSMQFDQVMIYADKALYKAKDGGRDQVRIFSDRRKESTAHACNRMYDQRHVTEK